MVCQFQLPTVNDSIYYTYTYLHAKKGLYENEYDIGEPNKGSFYAYTID